MCVWHVAYHTCVIFFIGGCQPEPICACGQGNPRSLSYFSKPPSAALDHTDYTLYALLKVTSLANTGGGLFFLSSTLLKVQYVRCLVENIKQ